MKQQVAIGIVAVALIGGSATGLAVRELRADGAEPVSASPAPTTPTPSSPATQPSASEPTPEETASTTPSAPDSSPANVVPLGGLKILTGAIGPVSVGMTQKQAAATGYFNVDVANDVCEGTRPLEWKSNYFNAVDVLTTQNGTITSLGVSNRGPKTRSGLEINSTYSDVQDVVGPGHAPERAGYGQTGVFVNDGDAWIGFLFAVQPESIGAGEPVTFIEVTRGSKPGLMRDGC